jgi:hypothetical protein
MLAAQQFRNQVAAHEACRACYKNGSHRTVLVMEKEI